MKEESAHPDFKWCVKKIRRSWWKYYYEIDYIIEQKVTIQNKRLYKVRWTGYGPEYDSWVESKHLHCPAKLAQFLEEQKRKEDIIC